MKAPTFEEIKRLLNQKSQAVFEGRMEEITEVY